MAEPTAPKGAPPPRHFGHGPLAQRLAHEVFDSLLPAGERRSELHPKTTGRLGPALVVGVFGEWGAGKSYLLSEVGDEIKALRGKRAEALVQRHLPDTEAGEPPTEITVLVEFNAWRFEREPHLLIPMLKVAEQALRKTLTQELPDDVRQREALSDRLALLSVLTQGLYDRGGREAIQLLLTAASSPVTLPKASKTDGPEKPSLGELYKSTKASLDKARELPAGVTHESLYFGFYEHLSAITGRNPKALETFRLRLTEGGIGWWPRLWHRIKQFFRWLGLGETRKPIGMTVNLIFMVDDLDRCLPEKAIEVLEAVKLFLDVEGCAFVLALDEEVVERGIAHRYQAYTSAAQGQTPITGAEYLEKLIHLPIRLPRPGGEDAQFYLAAHWPELYAQATSSAPADDPRPQPNELAELVATLTPPVPRKLQRITSLMQLNQSLAGQLEGVNGAAMPALEQRRWLALMCALQLFAPALFRYLRVQGAWLMQELVQWRQTLRLGDLKKLADELRQETQAVVQPYELRNAYARERLPELLQGSLSSRSGFSLLTWLEQVQDQASSRVDADPKTLQRLLALAVAEPSRAAAPGATSPSPAGTDRVVTDDAAQEEREREEEAPAPDGAEGPLAAGSGAVAPPPSARPVTPPPPEPQFTERARLDNEFALWEPLAAGDAAAFANAVSREGAALAGRYLPERLVQRLVVEVQNRTDHWLRAEGESKHPLVDLLNPLLTQDDVLRLGLPGLFGRPSWSQRTWMDSGWWTELGWPGPGAEPLRLCSLPPPPGGKLRGRRAWWGQEQRGDMPGGAWTIGADGEFGLYLDIAIADVTQRLRWIESGSFLMGSPFGEGEPESSPQRDVEIDHGFWIAETLCTQSLWQAVMGNNPSFFVDGAESALCPVNKVSYEDIQDFFTALAVRLPAGWLPDLPSESEWEYACRAGAQTAYFWGVDADDERANWNDKLGTTSPVKRYPQNNWGLYDTHGNVWEWCSTVPTVRLLRVGFDPTGAGEVDDLSVRGGAFNTHSHESKSTTRRSAHRNARSPAIGFRFILKSAPAPETFS